jgi:hypothetical protein
MDTRAHSMEQIAVFFCKDFPEVVRRVRCKEPLFLLETSHSFMPSFTDSNGDIQIPMEQAEFIRAVVTKGYTVTLFLRLSDHYGFVPFSDELETSAAMAVNEKILGKLSLGTLPN